MNAPTIKAATGLAALALLTASCAPATPPGSTPDPQLTRTGSPAPGGPAGLVMDAGARPPKPCRGGTAEGTGSVWVLELRDGDSPWYARRWSHAWSEWTTGRQMPRDEGAPLDARIYVHDNWSIALILEHDGQTLATSRLNYVDPCSYASRDRDDNLIRFYRTRL